MSEDTMDMETRARAVKQFSEAYQTLCEGGSHTDEVDLRRLVRKDILDCIREILHPMPEVI